MEDLLSTGYIGDCHVDAYAKILEIRREKDESLCRPYLYVSANLWIRVLQKSMSKMMDYNFNKWDLTLAKNVPTQINSYDCGVYVIKYMEHILKPGVTNWNDCEDWAEKMPLFRAEIAYEIFKTFTVDDDV
ncbi:Ubiquitin-like-specific protease ESD4 [Platanthera zijinensis]|uniref:Ubiquitin-like-specific protease ESD4 n=1 Tax=Platanthera zijinensis TaxID=2320716 RepID=A0AAP0AX75_9ASPA